MTRETSTPPPLRDFQKTGVKFLQNKKRALLADAMGTGKSCQSLNAVEGLNAYPCIVVCPSSVKFNWVREVKKWLPHRTAEVISGRKGAFKKADFYIINYDILSARIFDMKKLAAQGVIFDECHMMKNRNAARSKACLSLAATIPVRFGLSGTPILNRPQELVHQLKVLGLMKQRFGDEWPFLQKYCDGKQVWVRGRKVWDFTGASNLRELRSRLFEGDEAIALRRTKSEVLTELPPTQTIGVPVKLTGVKDYADAEEALKSYLIERGLMGKGETNERKFMAAAIENGGLAEVTRLRQVLAMGKLGPAKTWIREFLESTDEKLVVFAHHRAVIDVLMEEFGDVAVKLQGGDSDSNKKAAVDSFQNDPGIRLFFGNIQAAGVGINLTAASKGLFLETAWNPSLLEQAEDRYHRLGSEIHQKVETYYMVAMDTIEEDILDIIKEKKKVIEAGVGGR